MVEDTSGIQGNFDIAEAYIIVHLPSDQEFELVFDLASNLTFGLAFSPNNRTMVGIEQIIMVFANIIINSNRNMLNFIKINLNFTYTVG